MDQNQNGINGEGNDPVLGKPRDAFTGYFYLNTTASGPFVSGIFGRDPTSNTVQGLVSNGASFTSSPWLVFPTAGPAGPFAWADFVYGDFNGDGKIDIAAHDLNSGHEWVAINNGSSFTLSDWTSASNAWATPQALGTPITWVNFVVGDFNGDGKADIAARDLQRGNVFVALSSGSGFSIQYWNHWATAADLGGRPITWVDVLAGDFNGDGKTDLVGRFQEQGQVWVALSNGSGFKQVFWQHWATPAELGGQAITWANVQVGNFDGTGQANLFARAVEYGTTWISTAFNPNGPISSTTAVTAPGSVTLTTSAPPVGIRVGMSLVVDVGPQQETIRVSAVTATGFTATFAKTHPANFPIYVTQQFFQQWSTAVSWMNVLVGNFDNSGSSSVVARAATVNGQPLNTVWLSDEFNPNGPNSITTAVTAPGSATVTVASLIGIRVGTSLVIDSGANQEVVTVTAVTANSFTATCTRAHAAGASIYIPQQFLQQWPSTSGGVPMDWTNVVVGDFNGDGISDIAAEVQETGAWYVSDSRQPGFHQAFWGAVWDPRIPWANVQLAGHV
jgi:hypothetical protein